MRWSINKLRPSYLQYAMIVKAWESYVKARAEAGPTAIKRFDNELYAKRKNI